MAVYTPVTHADCNTFLQHYTLGELRDLIGISSGVTNTNYCLLTTSGQYVLTLFEHINAERLPFYLDLVTHLANAGLPCAQPIADNNHNSVQMLKGKPAVIQRWLPGKAVTTPSIAQCSAVGDLLWQLHHAVNTFSQQRINVRGQAWREEMLSKCRQYVDETAGQYMQRAVTICAQLPWQQLPQSIIHADLFPDNVLFDHDHISGVFDFYYACYDARLLDVAITVNAWSIDENSGKLDLDKARALLSRYQDNYQFAAIEKQYWPQALVAAALRFWLSRVYDQHVASPDPTGINQVKPPQPYYQLLLFYLNQPNTLGALEL